MNILNEGYDSSKNLFKSGKGPYITGNNKKTYIDLTSVSGTILLGHNNKIFGAINGTKLLQARSLRPALQTDALIPDDTRLWAALQSVSGGTWGGCVYDVDTIINQLNNKTKHE